MGLWAGCIILFFAFEYAFVVPFHSVWIDWLPDGTAVVARDVQAADVAPAEPLARVGDTLISIDGIPTRYTDLTFRFGPRSATHVYEFRRGHEIFAVPIASGTPTSLELLNLLLPAVVAFETWLVGLVLALMAREPDKDAWHLGFVLLGFAVALAAAPAGGVGVPGARLAYGVLLPITSVGYFEMAFLPNRAYWRNSMLFRVLYGVALLLAAGIVFEILFLNPGRTWTSVLGVRLEAVALGFLALSIFATPTVLAVRARRDSSGYSRRQANILLLGTGVALLPFVLFSALPQALTASTLLPVELTLPLLGAIPASYAYVIYRHRFLKLDLYAGQSMLLLIAGLIVAVILFSGLRLSQASPQLASLSPFVGILSVLLGIGVVRQTNTRLKPAIDVLLYGPDRHFDEALQVITRELIADPQSHTLHEVLVERVPAALDVRDAALFLPDHQGHIALAASAGNQAKSVGACAILANVSQTLSFQSAPEDELFRHYPWVRLALPLRVHDAARGVLLLGTKVSDAPFDYQEVGFVERAVGAAAFAGENIRLFEALREVAEQRLRERSMELKQLAFRLHDDPLHRTYTLAHGLETAIATLPPDHALADMLRAQLEELRRLSQELRAISAGLRPPIISQGLLLTLSQIVRAFEVSSPAITIELILGTEEEPTISEHALDAAYHVVTEALNNVVRHAGARSVQITLEVLSDSIRICIKDDGRGTPLATLPLPELVRNHHFGIAGMHEWAEMAGGRLRFTTVAPTGTSVELYIPLAEKQAN